MPPLPVLVIAAAIAGGYVVAKPVAHGVKVAAVKTEHAVKAGVSFPVRVVKTARNQDRKSKPPKEAK